MVASNGAEALKTRTTGPGGGVDDEARDDLRLLVGEVEPEKDLMLADGAGRRLQGLLAERRA